MKKPLAAIILLFMAGYFSCYSQNKQIDNTSAQVKNIHEISLDGTWLFKTDPNNEGEKQQWFSIGKQASFTNKLIVPGNWNTHNQYADYTGKAWYKKSILVPANLKGKLIRLHFDAVYNDAKVWVNGKFLMANNLGYLQFEKDASALLNYGAENEITVCADNSFKVGALWNWGGIRRPVKLLINNPLYIVQNHIAPKVDLKNHTADIDFDIKIFNKAASSQQVNGKVELYREGKLIKTIDFKKAVSSGSETNVILKTHLNPSDVKLWSLDDPYLYNCKVVLSATGVMVDEHTDRIGLRKIELDNEKHQLKLNGEVIRPLGFNLVPDDRTNGNSLPLWRVKEDIDMMKSLGAGMARMSHVPYHKELLDYLDEKGILIFEEIPVWGSNNPLVKSDNEITNGWLKRMINDHFNHPCIIGWSVGNEIGYNPDVMDYVDHSIKLVKQLDTTHMGVMISHSAERAKDPIQFSDLGLINHYGISSGASANKVHKFHPQKTLFFSEFGYNQLHEDLSSDFQIKALMDSISHKPFLIGASLWTFNDYRSPYKDTKEYSQNRPWGLVDVFRQKKKAFYSYQKANKPFANIIISDARLDKNKHRFNAGLLLEPHGVLDIPAYTLHNYRVVWKLLDKGNLLTGGGSKSLSQINPGDRSFNLSLDSKIKGADAVSANISVVSPLNYTMYDTTIYFHPQQVKEFDTRQKSDPALAAPFVRYTEPADGGFFVGFETLKTDNSFIAQVTDKPGNYTNAKETTATVKGVMLVDGLVNGKTYYYRIKRDMPNEKWSDEIKVVPDGGIKAHQPLIQGIIINNNHAILCFVPVKKSVGYELQYKSVNEKNWHIENITASQIDQYQFSIPANAKSIQVKFAAVNQYGKSVYSTFNALKE